ncbi:MAG: hypothetical protein HZA51_12315 [Planctomycetes bacterium]|nr:hypothetical protein [Planctomycetota bacterium]
MHEPFQFTRPYKFDPDAILQNVPTCLRDRRQWVCFRYIKRGGKQTKCPVNPMTGAQASSINSATWASFDQAVEKCKQCPDLAGIGFVFTPDDDYCGVDLDDCIDQATGEVKPWATRILNELSSYSEISPSGCGVKTFLRARKPGERCRKKYHDGEVEIYDQGRFFVVTGNRLPDFGVEVKERQEEIARLYADVFGNKKSPQSPISLAMDELDRPLLDDDAILRLAQGKGKAGDKFKSLMNGDWNENFTSQSEADSSLVFRLAFFTKDPVQIDRIFRRSGLFRKKWDEKRGGMTYGERTISRALEMVTDQYRPPSSRNRARSSIQTVVADSAHLLNGAPAPGTADPSTGRLILSPTITLPTARAFVEQYYRNPNRNTLCHYAGALMQWNGSRYEEIEDDAIRNQLQPWMHNAVCMRWNLENKSWEPRDFPANPKTIKAALDSIKTLTHLPATTTSPSWLDGRSEPDPRDILPCRSSLLHLPTMRLIHPTPAFFNVNALDYDFQPDAPEPTEWLEFLNQVFDGDVPSVELLQQFFGYCLTGDTSQQKMLLAIGPRRSGKGTIARVLAKLVGPGNVCGPTISGLAGTFGLQPLIGKSIAIVSDARFSGPNLPTVVERLLCISGEDTLTVDRKHVGSLTLKLPTRFLFLSNELPRFNDSSSALAGRFMMLRMRKSFYGREDTALTDKLLAKLPGILCWAIKGWHRLREQGRFIQPASVENEMRCLEELSSPVGAFVRECCVVKPELRITVSALYARWQAWCEAEGRDYVGTKQSFGRDLAAAVPEIQVRVGTDNDRFYQGIGIVNAPFPLNGYLNVGVQPTDTCAQPAR